MSPPVYGEQGVLLILSRTLYLESGIVGKFGLSRADDSADFCDAFLLVFSLFGIFYRIIFSEQDNFAT